MRGLSIEEVTEVIDKLHTRANRWRREPAGEYESGYWEGYSDGLLFAIAELMRISGGSGDSRLQAIEAKVEVMREAFQRWAAGEPLGAIATWAAREMR